MPFLESTGSISPRTVCRSGVDFELIEKQCKNVIDLQNYYRNGKFRFPGWQAGGSAFINIEVLVKNILLALIFIAFMMKSNIVSVENMNPMNLMNVDYNLANAL